MRRKKQYFSGVKSRLVMAVTFGPVRQMNGRYVSILDIKWRRRQTAINRREFIPGYRFFGANTWKHKRAHAAKMKRRDTYYNFRN